MTTESMIDYEALAQDAFRGIVRAVLTKTAKSGLPGDHHFYISFDTQAPGVMLSKRLKEKYPAEMTIVLQHRFWDLAVSEERFEVKLTFDGIPERLVVPFKAIKVFLDPSVRYGLQFDDPEFNAESVEQSLNLLDGGKGEGADNESRPQQRRPSPPARLPRKPAAGGERKSAAPAARLAKSDDAPGRRDAAKAKGEADKPGTEAAPADGAADAAQSEAARLLQAATDHQNERPRATTGAEIVSLDKFRKK
ncbi:MAG: ClpXP protease specificity-enhancing factor SspB [Hyphomicrobiaceae bacterium]|nr:ClpXP protease specificity-enhancing factor SspB [Hyphomicrobiaceae bacterium]